MPTQYEELAVRLVKWTADQSIAEMVEDFVDIVNADLNNRLRIRWNTVTARLALVPNSRLHPLPADFRGAVQASLNHVDMEHVTLEQMDMGYKPPPGCYAYAISGNNIRITPQPPQEQITVGFDPLLTLQIVVDTENPGSYFKGTAYINPQDQVPEGSHMYLQTARYYTASPEDPPDITNKIIYPNARGEYVEELQLDTNGYEYRVHAWYSDPEILPDGEADSDTFLIAAGGVIKNLGGGDQPVGGFLLPPLDLTYYTEMPELSRSGQTLPSIIYEKFPNLYFYGCLAEAFKYLYDNQRADTWKLRYEEALQEIINQDQEDVFSGSTLQIRAV